MKNALELKRQAAEGPRPRQQCTVAQNALFFKQGISLLGLGLHLCGVLGRRACGGRQGYSHIIEEKLKYSSRSKHLQVDWPEIGLP